VQKLLAGSPQQKEAEPQLAQMRQTSVKAEDLATAEKSGFFTGRYAINPFNNEKLPIWVENFVLMEYGTGAIMGRPRARRARLRIRDKIRFTQTCGRRRSQTAKPRN